MSYNPDMAAYLQVPGGSSDYTQQPSTSPQRSGSPRSLFNESLHSQQSSVSASNHIGGFRTRSRSGTMPSILYPSTSNGSTAAPAVVQSFSPSLNEYDPSLITMDSLSINSPVIEPSVGQANGKRRLRSGSLLGLSDTNSIWSVDSSQSFGTLPTSAQAPPSQQGRSMVHAMNLAQEPISPIHDYGRQDQNRFQIMEDKANRVRAYSTANVPYNEQSHYQLQQLVSNDGQAQQFAQPPPQQDVLQPLATISEYSNRPRAQTFQNGVQNVPIMYKDQADHNGGLPPFPHHNMPGEPLLLDRIDHRMLNWTSTYSDSSLGPTNTLFISNLPSHAITSEALANLLMKYGKLLTVRLFVGNEGALIEFQTVESAMQAKVQLHHQELLPGYSCLIAFAKILPPAQKQQRTRSPNVPPYQYEEPPLQHVSPPRSQGQQLPPQIQVEEQQQQQQHTPVSIVDTIPQDPPALKQVARLIVSVANKFNVDTVKGSFATIMNGALTYKGEDTDLGPLPDPIQIRDFDAPKLREVRKQIEGTSITQAEIEELAIAMLHELPELSSDYLGNTVVQKLFEFSSDPIKTIMLKTVSKYLPQMGSHKNGTWSAQKMISKATRPLQKSIVAESLQLYCVPLFNDQFGNYAIQGSLKFGSPWNDFIFVAIVAKFWLIVQNRYGARAVRACLESQEITHEQTALVAATIVLYSPYLAIDSNAALLVTWYLDTCTFGDRNAIIVPFLAPHLVQLCSHKLGGLTILKILNNRNEPLIRDQLLDYIFGDANTAEFSPPSHTLEQILRSGTHGVTFIYKVVSNPQLDVDIRRHLISETRRVLVVLDLPSNQQNKKLFDEVGYTARRSGEQNPSSHRHSRSHSNGNNGNNGANGGRKLRSNKSSNGFNRRSMPANGYRASNDQPQPQQQPSQQAPPPLQTQFNNGPIPVHNGPQFEYPSSSYLQGPPVLQPPPQQHYQQNQYGGLPQYGFGSTQY